jgi:hypothetical protein
VVKSKNVWLSSTNLFCRKFWARWILRQMIILIFYVILSWNAMDDYPLFETTFNRLYSPSTNIQLIFNPRRRYSSNRNTYHSWWWKDDNQPLGIIVNHWGWYIWYVLSAISQLSVLAIPIVHIRRFSSSLDDIHLFWTIEILLTEKL